MVSEYKTKLQIAEAENARLEGLVRKEAWLSLLYYLFISISLHPSLSLPLFLSLSPPSLSFFLSLSPPLSPFVQTNRLQNQATRYKNQVKELEEREDQLMKEKRHQAKEVSSEIHKTFSPQICNCVFTSFFLSIATILRAGSLRFNIKIFTFTDSKSPIRG